MKNSKHSDWKNINIKVTNILDSDEKVVPIIYGTPGILKKKIVKLHHHWVNKNFTPLFATN